MGSEDGATVGVDVGSLVGCAEGEFVGVDDGARLGTLVGGVVGRDVGFCDGVAVVGESEHCAVNKVTQSADAKSELLTHS